MHLNSFKSENYIYIFFLNRRFWLYANTNIWYFLIELSYLFNKFLLWYQILYFFIFLNQYMCFLVYMESYWVMNFKIIKTEYILTAKRPSVCGFILHKNHKINPFVGQWDKILKVKFIWEKAAFLSPFLSLQTHSLSSLPLLYSHKKFYCSFAALLINSSLITPHFTGYRFSILRPGLIC